ncbi:hypothetical protein [Rhizobium sp. LjRoot254]|uniref:hypothetical protein n=1 Tax=Rhizobium sp. LjRoot254 TaxID=3342297 RepID=UPI003ECCE275
MAGNSGPIQKYILFNQKGTTAVKIKDCRNHKKLGRATKESDKIAHPKRLPRECER